MQRFLDRIDAWLPPEAAAFVQGRTFLIAAGALVLLYALAWCRIFARAGHHGALGIVMLVPIVNFVLLLVLAFGSWPRERELFALRRVQRAARQADDVVRRAA